MKNSFDTPSKDNYGVLLFFTFVSILSLKRHGGWKSSNVAEEYIDESRNNKVEVANEIFDTPDSISNENHQNEINQKISYAASTSINSRCLALGIENRSKWCNFSLDQRKKYL